MPVQNASATSNVEPLCESGGLSIRQQRIRSGQHTNNDLHCINAYTSIGVAVRGGGALILFTIILWYTLAQIHNTAAATANQNGH